MADNFSQGGMAPPPPPGAYQPPVQAPRGGTPWLKILGCGCLIVVLLVVIGVIAFALKGREMYVQAIEEGKGQVMALVDAQQPDLAPELRTNFERATAVYREKKIGLFDSMMAAGIVHNRVQDVTQDSKVTPEEVTRLNEVLTDIADNPQNFDFKKYPGGR